jgi:hypothetical protein
MLKIDYLIWLIVIPLELQRGYSEDAAEADEGMANGPVPEDSSRNRKSRKSVKVPSRPTRAGSISKDYERSNQMNGSLDPGKMPRASSELQLNSRRKDHTPDPDSKDGKKKSRGKSPFR